MSGIDYAVVIGFLVVMGLGGLFLSRLVRDADDFMVAGRELTPFILCAAMSTPVTSRAAVSSMANTCS